MNLIRHCSMRHQLTDRFTEIWMEPVNVKLWPLVKVTIVPLAVAPNLQFDIVKVVAQLKTH